MAQRTLVQSLVVVLLLTVFGTIGLAALDVEAVEAADARYESDDPSGAIAVLERALSTARTGEERAEVLWRLSRATLDVGQQLQDVGADVSRLLAAYERGEQFAKDAIAADPANHLGYYWQSANIGRWGQAKGILNSLFKAGPMRDLLRQAINVNADHAGSYFVLGQLYAQVPGVISFGNVDYAVSLGRKSIVLHEDEYARGVEDEVEYDYYVQLASHLIKRGWDQRRRDREQDRKRRSYERNSDVLERGWYFEGTLTLPAMSDAEEARGLLERAIRDLEAIPARNAGQNRHLAKARELRSGL